MNASYCKNLESLQLECEKVISGHEPSKEKICNLIIELKKHEEPSRNIFADQGAVFNALGGLHLRLSEKLKESSSGWKKKCTSIDCEKDIPLFPENLIKAINYLRNIIFFNATTLNKKSVEINLASILTNQKRHIETLNQLIICDFNEEGDRPTISRNNKAISLIFLKYHLKDIDTDISNFYYYEAYLLAKEVQENIDNGKVSDQNAINNFNNSQNIQNCLNDEKNRSGSLDGWQKKHSKSDSYEGDERKYRGWCLKEKLFINHLNDITTEWIADGDTLDFPDHNNPEGKSQSLTKAFSALKREYCFARHLAYEGIHKIHPPYEDNKITLVNTKDKIYYNGYIQKIKTALRLSFSTLDSIAFIMHKYFECTGKVRKVGFNPEWFSSNLSQTEENPFIDALYWLSYDFFYGDKNAPIPVSVNIRTIRNIMEHSYLQVSERKLTITIDEESERSFDYIVLPSILQYLTLSTLKLVRAAILYLTMAVSWNEKNEEEKRNKKPKL